MALSLDTTALAPYNTSTGSTSVNATAGATGAIAFMWTWTGTGDNLTGVTVGGSATGVTLVGSVTDGGQTIRCYYYLNPSTSSTAYAATTSNVGEGVEMIVHLYAAAKQTGQPDSSASATGIATLALTTTVVAANCWLACALRNRTAGGTPTAGSGTTLRVSGSGISSYDSNGTVGTGAQSLNVSAAGGNAILGYVVSMAPSVAGGAASVSTQLLMGV